MVIARTVEQMREARGEVSSSVGFVPTMGALHEGHISLIRRARQECETLVVSIFVNPTQFLEGEDLDNYPRKDEADIEICKLAGVDILFMPTIEQMYESDELSIGAPMLRGYTLEGAKRPGHFDGMLQIVLKLLLLTRATRAYFGKKDAQQLSLITQMVQNYFVSTEIVPCDIVRDSGGLALSSRNTYLSSEERGRALALSRSLQRATNLIISGNLNAPELKSQMLEVLWDETIVEYVAIVDKSFKEIDRVEIGNSIILVAAWVGKTRLIDNIWI